MSEENTLAKTDIYASHGGRWSEAEEAQLWEGVKGGKTLNELAHVHGRTVGALEARLLAMGAYDYGDYTGVMVAKSDDGATNGQTNAGLPWTEPEVGALLAMHLSTGTAAELVALAGQLGRSPKSLVLKLVQLGALTPTLTEAPLPWAGRAPKTAAKAPAPKVLVSKPTATVKISVTPEFQTALRAVEAGENLLILGSAGTGKSTFLKWLKHRLGASKKLAVVAPTGMAALNIGGQTLHSFFGLKPQLMQGNKHDWHKPRNPKLFGALELLVIDEISMVRADMLGAIDAFLRTYGPKIGKPFGGVQVLMMGDLCQLPPVVRREELAHFEETFGTPFFFSSPSYAALAPEIVGFTEIFRQADAPFINLLNAVRLGQLRREELAALNARVVGGPPAGAVVLAARNRTVDEINAVEMAKLAGAQRTYSAEVTGTMDVSNLTTPAELVLKRGARVMFTRNDGATGRWVNGSLGTVQKMSDDDVEVKLDNGEVHVVEPVKWESVRYAVDAASDSPVAVVGGTFVQLPLTLAWALTIHKAQGQTIERVHINLGDGGTFAEGQLYVALSRAKSLSGLTLSEPILPKHVKTHPAVVDFYERLGAL